MSNESEEKSLPASQKKLRDARRKGQVPHSRDLVSGFTLTLMLIYLWLAWPALGDRLVELMDIIPEFVDLPFVEAASRALRLSLEVLLLASLPLIAILVVGDLVAGIAGTLGPVFSFDLVKLKFERINPAEGLKRIFSVRNVVEFAKSAVKVVVLCTAFVVILRGTIQSLFEIPVCGAWCLTAEVVEAAKPLVATAAVAFLTVGLFDLLIQRQLFLRDMRMTRTENKRERKELEGDPLLRRERRRRRVLQVAAGTGNVGISRAVIAIMHGDQVVGLRYRTGETPVPFVVCKADGQAGLAMLAELRERGIPIVDDAEFVAALAAKHRVGDMIDAELFPAVARALVAAGIS
ncbi:EscU/YscU/HrcU family type III secretion system export apparatus switch protein [Bradyrhizobium sp.]|uniref:EscU/YscU/HrcU family type III secretion system export apparatus switch protein n=1 Tax=Bradyrhizobium sp. TaxID=376 RepID=UPI003C35992D